MLHRILAASLLCVGLALSPALAAEEQRPPASNAPEGAALPPSDVVTSHTIKLGGKELAYTATAGALPLTNLKGE